MTLHSAKFLTLTLLITLVCKASFMARTEAAILVYYFAGTWTVNTTHGNAGDTFSGSFSYDTTATDQAGSPSYGQFLTGSSSLDSTLLSGPRSGANFYTLRNAIPDYFQVGLGTAPALEPNYLLTFTDSTANYFSSDADTDSLPNTPFDLSPFTSTEIISREGMSDSLAGNVTYLGTVPVPEPSSFALTLLGMSYLGMRRRRVST